MSIICKTLVRTSLSCRATTSATATTATTTPLYSLSLRSFSSLISSNAGIRLKRIKAPLRRYGCARAAVPVEISGSTEETVPQTVTVLEAPEEDLNKDRVEKLLNRNDDVSTLMKMERRPEPDCFDEQKRWFPYLDKFKVQNGEYLSSEQVLEAMDPYIMDTRKERFRHVVKNRSYSVCLVVEGLTDFGNVSAAFRSADAMGIQSVHVVSRDSKKRYRGNRHVSMGAEKWLDIELWDSTQECFKHLKSRGYRVATTHLGMDTVSVYDMDWSCPTAIVVGNENRGISDEALELSDLHCSIPMRGMVDSFNVSVAAGILMHHAVCDRTSRMGSHGDLTLEESQILLAEFSLRHSETAISIANEYAKRKLDGPTSKLSLLSRIGPCRKLYWYSSSATSLSLPYI